MTTPTNRFLQLLLKPAECLVKLLDNYTMEANKIAASIFLAGIIAMIAGFIAEGVYPGAKTHGASHTEAKRGYTIAGAEAFELGASGTAAAPAADTGPVDIAPFMAKADIAEGAKLIKRCTACHTFEKGGKNGVGPNNYGVVGGPVAHVADFNYSEAILAKKGEKWTEQNLSDFLANPKAYAPGNKMAFAGLKKPEDRANLIKYIESIK
jgi:cytochrome c